MNYDEFILIKNKKIYIGILCYLFRWMKTFDIETYNLENSIKKIKLGRL